MSRAQRARSVAAWTCVTLLIAASTVVVAHSALMLLFVIFSGFVAVFAYWCSRFVTSWVGLAHVVFQLGLVLTVLAVAGLCVDAATGGRRVGSRTVGVGAGDQGLMVLLHTGTIDQRTVPTARRLNADGYTTGLKPMTSATLGYPRVSASTTNTLVVLASGAVSLLPLFAGLLLVERLLRRARRGAPFSEDNLRDLRILAAVIGFGVPFSAVIDFAAASWLLDGTTDELRFGAGELTLAPTLRLELWPLAVGAVILALAEVWRQGIDLRNDVEATV